MIKSSRWGRDFLEKSQLRSLRNISFLPQSTAEKVLLRLENLAGVEIHFLEQYRNFCNGKITARDIYNVWYWTIFPAPEPKDDPYRYCYTPDYNLTTLGQRMKDATYHEQAKL